ncbi:hypothetical protein PVK06_011019 [Gossypium arboreum]|uniref:Uncharacterized protein n=1 Tax=Gossypium arboreum TaxID=29729 RepID=A0ABR0Q7X8_GOSAR|nr:hypothetical protein PVK06_011019 [Gossypium arboreum]
MGNGQRDKRGSRRNNKLQQKLIPMSRHQLSMSRLNEIQRKKLAFVVATLTRSQTIQKHRHEKGRKIFNKRKRRMDVSAQNNDTRNIQSNINDSKRKNLDEVHMFKNLAHIRYF